jgi:CAAX prenyl protease-like protein
MEASADSNIPESKRWLFEGEAPPLPRGIWGRWPGLTFILPFAVYMIVGMFEPGPPKKIDPNAAGKSKATAVGEETEPGVVGSDGKRRDKDGHIIGEHDELDEKGYVQMPYRYYPRVYTIKIIATVVAMLLVFPGYMSFPLRLNWIAIAVGVVGVALWIGICKLQLEQRLLVPMGLGSVVGMGARAGFNPLEQLKDDPTWAYQFLAIRLFGLAIIVPIIEEFFLRGFLIRFVMDIDWFKIPFGKVDKLGLITSVAFPMLMHPGELFAAFVWFSLVTWLMLKTRNIWDCVAAHAVTNGLLGAYVLWSGEWQFM